MRDVDGDARVEQLATGVDLIGLEQGVAHPMALGGEEGEAHSAADDERVGDLAECLDDAELVGDLRSSEDHDEGPCRRFAQRQKHLDLSFEQSAGGRGQELGRTDDGSMRPVRGAECIVDIEVLTSDEGLHERRIVGGLTRVEAQVVEQFHTRGQLGEPTANWLDRVPRIGSALGPTEVRAGRDGGTTTGEPFDGRQRRTDAEVVDDLAMRDRHVEVGAQQDATTGDVAEVLEVGDAHRAGTTWSRP